MNRQSRLALFWALLVVLGFCTMTVPANAVSIDCREPKLIRDAEVNTVVLSYSYAGPVNKALNGAAAQVTPLILYDSLLSQLLYRSRNIAVIQLSYPEGGIPGSTSACAPDDITKKLITQLLPGHKLLFIWGNLFEDGASLFIQSFLSIHYSGTE
jgi:hypothetical protein